MYYSCVPEEEYVTYWDPAQCVRYGKMFIYFCAVYVQSYDHKLRPSGHGALLLYSMCDAFLSYIKSEPESDKIYKY